MIAKYFLLKTLPDTKQKVPDSKQKDRKSNDVWFSWNNDKSIHTEGFRGFIKIANELISWKCFGITGHLWREITAHRGIPFEKGKTNYIYHYCGVIMGSMASLLTSLTSVYSTVHSGADQRKHQSSSSLARLCAGNSPEAGDFPILMASNAENVSIRWRHHDIHKVKEHCTLKNNFLGFVVACTARHNFICKSRKFFPNIHIIDYDTLQ